MNLCPRCKEPMPPLSKVCPVCGYTDTTGQSDGGENRVSESLADLEKRLTTLRSLPESTCFEGMRAFLFVVYPVALLCMIVLAAAWGNLLLWGLALLFLVLTIVEAVQKLRGKRAADGQNRRVKALLAEYDSAKRELELSYGKNREVRTAITQVDAQLQQALQGRTAHARKTKICGAGIALAMIVVLLLICWGGVSTALSLAREATAQSVPALLEEKRYDEAAQLYGQQYALDPALATSTELRVQMVQGMVSATELDQAQRFFFDYCMGNLDDFECASMIVYGLKLADRSEAAADFVAKCTGMRYRSDLSRLKQIINK